MTIQTARPYQREALDAVYKAWRTKRLRNPLVVAPTGSGKGTIIGLFCQEALRKWPRTKIIVATHVQELVEQNYERLKGMWPDAPAGIYAAGLRRKDAHSPIIFASIQSIAKKAYDVQGCDVLIIDEAHLLSRNPSSMYQTFIADCLTIRPHMKVLGFTASPYRLDSGYLTDPYKGQLPLFDGMAHEISIRELLEGGYLAPLITRGTSYKIDTSKVKKAGGEFIAKQLQSATDIDAVNKAIASEAVRLGHDRDHWICFCVGVQHAYHMRDAFNALGIKSETVTGETPKAERAKIIEDFKAGKIQCLTNADVLTTGFDAPHIDYIIMARATASPGLYLQMCGRGMRPAVGKFDCLVADFAGNALEHGPVDQVRGPSRKDLVIGQQMVEAEHLRGGKECPKCHTMVSVQQINCPNCDHVWPRDYFAKLSPQASEAPILSGAKSRRWVDVTDVEYSQTRDKYDTIDLFQARYKCGMTQVYNEIIVFHGMVGRRRAEDWWKRRTEAPVPADIKTALFLSAHLKKPRRIMIEKQGKYWNVVAAEFGDGSQKDAAA